MAREYFIALDESGYRLFDSKPRLVRVVANPCHWEWRDSERGRGLALIPVYGRPSHTMFRDIKMNSYIKLIDFGRDDVFTKLELRDSLEDV